MSSHLDCWLNIVDNGNSSDDGSFLIKHHVRKWMRNFVEPLLNNKSTSEMFLIPFDMWM